MEHVRQQLGDVGVIEYGELVLRGGETAQYYIDIKKSYGNPEVLATMADAMLETLDPRTTCIAASGYGGLPLGIVISQLTHLPLAMVRDTQKGHGRGSVIDGYVPTEYDIVSVVDDVYTSGSSLQRTISNLADTRAVVVGCHVIVARGDVENFDIPVQYLLAADDLTSSK